MAAIRQSKLYNLNALNGFLFTYQLIFMSQIEVSPFVTFTFQVSQKVRDLKKLCFHLIMIIAKRFIIKIAN